jgi:hypothetical protein
MGGRGGKERYADDVFVYPGNTLGHVILFDPSNSEHSSTRTINDPIKAIAPAADCQAYAIGSVLSTITGFFFFWINR